MDSLRQDWKYEADQWVRYLRLECRLAHNTVESYRRDLHAFAAYTVEQTGHSPAEVSASDIEAYLCRMFDVMAEPASQARALSALKNFFRYSRSRCDEADLPTQFIEAPKIPKKLPHVLSTDQIDSMIGTIDLSSQFGHRNKAIIETLYSCGLRVSELTELQLNDLFFDDGFVRVTGKGDKQRLVPLSDTAINALGLYIEQRPSLPQQAKYSGYVFLNRSGRKISRISIFKLIQTCAVAAGIHEEVSPHTLRHSFATHLLEGGASIRQVQEMLGHQSILTTEIYTHVENTRLGKMLEQKHPLGKMNRTDATGKKKQR